MKMSLLFILVHQEAKKLTKRKSELFFETPCSCAKQSLYTDFGLPIGSRIYFFGWTDGRPVGRPSRLRIKLLSTAWAGAWAELGNTFGDERRIPLLILKSKKLCQWYISNLWGVHHQTVSIKLKINNYFESSWPKWKSKFTCCCFLKISCNASSPLIEAFVLRVEFPYVQFFPFLSN